MTHLQKKAQIISDLQQARNAIEDHEDLAWILDIIDDTVNYLYEEDTTGEYVEESEQ